MKRIGCVGDNCVDHYRQTGEDHFGGNPVNVAVYTRRLGGGISYVGAVGTDGRGAALLDALRGRGVDVSHVHVDEGSTAVTYVEHINGDRVFGDYDEGVMARFALTEEDIAFLRGKGCFDEPFLDYLRSFRFTGDMWAVPEGTFVFPGEPLITVRAPAIQAQFIETYLLMIVNHESLIATKAARITRAAKGRAVSEFGSRRAQGSAAAIDGARAAYILSLIHI